MNEQSWQPVLDWWFGEGASATAIAARRNVLWFGKKQEQDREADVRFGVLVRRAMACELDDWMQSSPGWLALLILLDQLPRMIYRNTPQAYAGDIHAQSHAARGLAKGMENGLRPIEQVFVYLVLEHAEDLSSQQKSVDGFTRLRDNAPKEERAVFENYLDYARRHFDIIERFGRFPHRNGILGRVSTAEETVFLQTPGSHF